MLVSPVKTFTSTSLSKESKAEEKARKQFEKDKAKVSPYGHDNPDGKD